MGCKKADNFLVEDSPGPASTDPPSSQPDQLNECTDKDMMKITCALEGMDTWETFWQEGTEMIITKAGRCVVTVSGVRRIAGMEAHRGWAVGLSHGGNLLGKASMPA